MEGVEVKEEQLNEPHPVLLQVEGLGEYLLIPKAVGGSPLDSYLFLRTIAYSLQGISPLRSFPSLV